MLVPQGGASIYGTKELCVRAILRLFERPAVIHLGPSSCSLVKTWENSNLYLDQIWGFDL